MVGTNDVFGVKVMTFVPAEHWSRRRGLMDMNTSGGVVLLLIASRRLTPIAVIPPPGLRSFSRDWPALARLM